MRYSLRSTLFLILIIWGLWPAEHAAAASAPSNCAPDGLQNSGAVYRICMPALRGWNGDLVIYAHGYVAFNEPVAIPEDQLALPEGPSVVEIVNSLGYAFATTSYSTNGLAIQAGLQDVVDLVEIFSALHGQPGRVYIVGPSEGGIVTALAVERYPEIFDGGLSACGPVGDFPSQINYWGDVRVTFDYFFPDVLPPSAIDVPAEAIENWESVYEPLVRARLVSQPDRRKQWMAAVDIPEHPSNLDETVDSLAQLLWYSVFATNDGVEKLNGQPFDNSQRIYRGARNDAALNYFIKRYVADPSAIAEMQTNYQTTGNINRPLVMLHTTDPVIPLWHEGIYALKVTRHQQTALFTNLTFLQRYGHCNFTTAQMLVGFIILVDKVTQSIPVDSEAVLAADQRQEYRELFSEHFGYLPPNAEGYQLFIPSIEN